MSLIISQINDQTKEKLSLFKEKLIQWNTHINLISSKDIDHIWDRHIYDSLQLIPYIKDKDDIIDLGSGGGFPGMILAIALPNKITLIESDQRKCAFLHDVSHLCRGSVTILPQRIETITNLQGDVITARALAPLNKLLYWASPLIKEHGKGLFLKGKNYKAELKEAKKNWEISQKIFKSQTHHDGIILEINGLKKREH